MARDHILTSDGYTITTEDGEAIITTQSSAAKPGRASSYKRPSTFWKRYWYFYERKAKRGKRR